MHKLVERSITLSKVQHGPFRDRFSRPTPLAPATTTAARGRAAAVFDQIDYTARRCDYY